MPKGSPDVNGLDMSHMRTHSYGIQLQIASYTTYALYMAPQVHLDTMNIPYMDWVDLHEFWLNMSPHTYKQYISRNCITISAAGISWIRYIDAPLIRFPCVRYVPRTASFCECYLILAANVRAHTLCNIHIPVLPH